MVWQFRTLRHGTISSKKFHSNSIYKEFLLLVLLILQNFGQLNAVRLCLYVHVCSFLMKYIYIYNDSSIQLDASSFVLTSNFSLWFFFLSYYLHMFTNLVILFNLVSISDIYEIDPNFVFFACFCFLLTFFFQISISCDWTNS